jgi:NAD(P)-dependent dehydrogenase (short-subunit alcohol dehydrogenase family)
MRDKVALVTGAGSGIGRAVALAFAKAGARVLAADIDAAGGEETVRLIRDTGGTAAYHRCDVSRSVEVKTMVEATVGRFGRLDFACNIAGIHNAAPEALAQADEEIWDRIIAVNLKGVFLCMKYEVRCMAAAGGGAIVNMASLAGVLAEPGCYAYVASKHGILGLTKTAAFDCAKAGIRINAVCPAGVDTPGLQEAPEEFRQKLREATPVGRIGTPEEIAAAVLWLCSDAAGFVTGTGLVMDGGVSCI